MYKLWYMLDNHTFVALEGTEQEVIQKARDTFRKNVSARYGMIDTKEKDIKIRPIHVRNDIDQMTKDLKCALNAYACGGITVDEGRKDDAEKDRWDLLPYREVEQVVKVLTHGAQKYADWNWLKVSQPNNRYFAAAMRHLVAWRRGELYDEESGLNHLAHAACCLLFLLHFEPEAQDEVS